MNNNGFLKLMILCLSTILIILGILNGVPILQDNFSAKKDSSASLTNTVTPNNTPEATPNPTQAVGKVEFVDHGYSKTVKAEGFLVEAEEILAVKQLFAQNINGSNQIALDYTINEEGIAYIPILLTDREICNASEFLEHLSGDITKVARVGNTFVLEFDNSDVSIDYDSTQNVSTASDKVMSNMICEKDNAIMSSFVSHKAYPNADNYFGTLSQDLGFNADLSRAMVLVETADGEYALRFRVCDCVAPEPTEKPNNPSPTKQPPSPTKQPPKPTKEPPKPTKEPPKPTEGPSHPETTKTPNKPTEKPSHPETTKKPENKKPAPPKVEIKDPEDSKEKPKEEKPKEEKVPDVKIETW